MAGVTTVDKLRHMKMRLKALKAWAEEQYTLGNTMDIRDFTTDVCQKCQKELAEPKRLTRQEDRQGGGKEKLEKF